MVNKLSKTGISTGEVIQASQVSQSVDALTGIVDYDIDISGSLKVTGSTVLSGSSVLAVRGGDVSITASVFNATLTQGIFNLGYSNNAGIIRAGTISASRYYVSQSLYYEIISASIILANTVTASIVSASSNLVTNEITASIISASSNLVTKAVTASIVSASSNLVTNEITTSNLLITNSINISSNYDFIKFQREITLGSNSGPYNFSIFKITSSLKGIDSNPNVTGSGILIDPLATTIGNNNRWRSIQWNNNEGYGLYGSGSALNYIAGPLEISNSLLVTNNITASIISASNKLITNTVTASIISASSNLVTSNITASNITASNITASIISASNKLITSNIIASIISASSNLVTNEITASIISASSNLVTSNITASNITASIITASIISASSNLVTSNITASNITASIISASSNLVTSNITASNITASNITASIISASNKLITSNITTSNITATNDISTTTLNTKYITITDGGNIKSITGTNNLLGSFTVSSSGITNVYLGISGQTSYTNKLDIDGPNEWASTNIERKYIIPDVGVPTASFLLNSSSLSNPQSINSPIRMLFSPNIGAFGIFTGSTTFSDNDTRLTPIALLNDASTQGMCIQYQFSSSLGHVNYCELASANANNAWVPGSKPGDFIISNYKIADTANLTGGNIILQPSASRKVFITAYAVSANDIGFEVKTNSNHILALSSSYTSALIQNHVTSALGSGRTAIFGNGGEDNYFNNNVLDAISISTGNARQIIRVTGSLKTDRLAIPMHRADGDNQYGRFDGRIFFDGSDRRLKIFSGSHWYLSPTFIEEL